MKPPATGFVFFDLGNVLVNFEHQRACRNLAALCGCSEEDARRELFESGLEDRYESGQVTTSAFCDELRQRLGVSTGDAELTTAASAIFEINAPMTPLVSQLAASGAALGVLSNTCEGHWRYCLQRYRILRSCFSVFALSYELQVMKPAPEIYRRAAAAVACPPEAIFFVDDREDNVRGAADAGWDAVLYEGPAPLARQLRRRGFDFNY